VINNKSYVQISKEEGRQKKLISNITQDVRGGMRKNIIVEITRVWVISIREKHLNCAAYYARPL
jgi:hypothetical protein